MNRISTLLILVFIPISLTAQNKYTKNLSDKTISPDKHHLPVENKSAGGTKFWLNIGPGIGFSGSISGVAGVSYQFGRNILTLRSSATGELFGDEMIDAGLLFGRATVNTSHHLSIAAGLAYVTGQRSEGLFGPAEDVSPGVGLPIELQLFWKPASFFGIGVTGFANINQELSYAGIAFTLQIGKLR